MPAGVSLLHCNLGVSADGARQTRELKIGITTFLSGPASVFGVPAKAAAEMIAEDLNKKGGIGGVPVTLSFTDEGAGGEALVSNYRRMVQDEKVDVTFAAISTGSCTQLAPLADDLKMMNFMWDCGAASILRTRSRYNFRSQANATPEMIAVLVYLLKIKPDFKTIAVVNQDYAWGRESQEIFSTALKFMKPDVKVVAELFPKFGAPDFSTEISRLMALKPDVVMTTFGAAISTRWCANRASGGCCSNRFHSRDRGIFDPAARQGFARGPDRRRARRPLFLHPEIKNEPAFKAFNKAFKDKTGSWPIYPVYHMARRSRPCRAAYDKAIKANSGKWPTREQVIDAAVGSNSRAGRPVKLRPDDHQGLESQMVGVTKNGARL